MSSSNVPSPSWSAAGLSIPAESDILAGALADINAAFGGTLNTSLETPQGQLASSEAAIIGDKNAEVALITNQVDPQYSDGRFQDAIGRIYFLTRKVATSTSVSCTLTGLPGTVIPAGTYAQDTTGNLYASTAAITIGLAGTATGEFQNVVTGPIACPAGALTQVYQAVSGWDAITNAAAGTLGTDVESRADFEYRRKNSVAANAHGSLASIYGAVASVDNVIDVYATENTSASPLAFGPTNYVLAPHSLYVAVVGGVAADIAQAIWTKKDVGCDTNGNTTEAIQDTTGYSYPIPTYNIKFEIPTSLPILFIINIANNTALPSNIATLIQTAVIAQFNGTNGGTRERIGSEIFASRYFSPVAAANANVSVVSIFIGTVTANSPTVSVGIDQAPTVTAANIVVNLV